MPAILRRRAQQRACAPAVLALFLATLLACDLPNLLDLKSKPISTHVTPPTEVSTQPTQATATGTQLTPTPSATPTATPTETQIPTETQKPGPATDPCNLPGIQFRADFNTPGTTNALTAPFSGDVSILKPAGGPNIISIQEASVQRKFVILLPNLNPGVRDLTSTYMSYTEKTGANDKNPRIWKATAGYLEVLSCPVGGMALRTVADLGHKGDPVLFQPLPGGGNSATGMMLVEVGAKIN
jgi:hypothetical protein